MDLYYKRSKKMWLLLKEDISKVFESKIKYTYLFPINKNNFFIGKNNSGKSYFSRFLMKNSIKFYKNKNELIDDISNNLKNTFKAINEFKNFINEEFDFIVDEYLNYEQLLKKIDNNKIEKVRSISMKTGAVDRIYYQFNNKGELFQEIKPLLKFLNIDNVQNDMETTLSDKVIPKISEFKDKIKEEFIKEYINKIKSISEDKIYELGDLAKKLEVTEDFRNLNEKFYIPVTRSIRNPNKEINEKSMPDDIYKIRYIAEYDLNEEEIKVISGLEFYKSYKSGLLGSKEKREKVNKFENFLSQYFFDGEDISIIPDEETFELKININDSKEDRFIYEVGDGISSLLIIAYTIFTEACEKDKLFFIEEPEISFHPGFQRLLVNIITYYKEFKNCIFFFSTHSNHLIDIGVNEIKNSNLILCKKDNSDNISIEIQGALYNEILEELGVQASSVRIANKIIWVEGKYDALYIRLLLNMKNKDNNTDKKYIEDYDYCFLPYGGANMSLIKFDMKQDYEENEEFITRAKNINRNFIIILDDDNMSLNKKGKKYKRYSILKEELGDKIYKLEVREIENLFPEKVLANYVYNGLRDKTKVDETKFLYKEYKNRKLGEYINKKVKETYISETLEEVTGRKNGFEKNGFLYNKQKYYEEVLKWTKEEDFNYERDVTEEAKKLINIVENFIKN